MNLLTLDEIRDEQVGKTFPRALLRRCDNALCLFAAGFLGRQDALWLADAKLRVTCVDTDRNMLGQMQPLYPDDWEFECADAFQYVEDTGRMWDLVTVDCPSNMFPEAAAAVGLWCEHAREAVVLGTDQTPVVPPDGWVVTQTRKRSDYVPGGVFWSVLERKP